MTAPARNVLRRIKTARNYKARSVHFLLWCETLVIQMYLSGPELLFVAADATWRCEAAKVLNCKSNDLGLILLPEARGEPDTLLRTAFEVRERAYAVWCQASETLSANDACPVIPSPNDRS
ncbi:hypothetical protein [Methylorubrum populi]|uniref:hypothetical protein n=1 Tax=Methylorubrum populi TaxID=223967 RepID=UPI001FCED9E4|nr:hypothetical protein [Methylorubrum populi]